MIANKKKCAWYFDIDTRRFLRMDMNKLYLFLTKYYFTFKSQHMK